MPPILRRNFVDDFRALTAGIHPSYSGEPYAFARFGDGERAVMEGTHHDALSDGWWIRDGHTTGWLRERLNQCLTTTLPGYCVGIPCPAVSCGCHSGDDSRWFVDRVRAERGWNRDRVTFASIFIFANYRRWESIDISHCCLVGSWHGGQAHHEVPRNAICPPIEEWQVDELVDALLLEPRPILVAAGPLANIIVHEYWIRANEKKIRPQVIIDIGSILDRKFRRQRTRTYQMGHTPAYARRCKWPDEVAI